MKKLVIAAAGAMSVMAAQLPAGFACDGKSAAATHGQPALAGSSTAPGSGKCAAGWHWQDTTYFDHVNNLVPAHCVRG